MICFCVQVCVSVCVQCVFCVPMDAEGDAERRSIPMRDRLFYESMWEDVTKGTWVSGREGWASRKLRLCIALSGTRGWVGKEERAGVRFVGREGEGWMDGCRGSGFACWRDDTCDGPCSATLFDCALDQQ